MRFIRREDCESLRCPHSELIPSMKTLHDCGKVCRRGDGFKVYPPTISNRMNSITGCCLLCDDTCNWHRNVVGKMSDVDPLMLLVFRQKYLGVRDEEPN
jgi:hypothetical protein